MRTNNSLFIFVLANLCILYCQAVSIQEQLEHVARRRRESLGIPVGHYRRRNYRRLLGDDGVILGKPSRPSHLPEAEPILPGHTLLRPAIGMLKSAIKFPHKDLDEGSGVYGNYENLGIRYPGTQDRVQYGSFRRMPSDYLLVQLPSVEIASAQPKLFPKADYLVSQLGLKPVDKDDAVLKVLNELSHKKSFKPRKTQKKPYVNVEKLLSMYFQEKQNAKNYLKKLVKSQQKLPDERYSDSEEASASPRRRMIMSSDEIEAMRANQKTNIAQQKLKMKNKKKKNKNDTKPTKLLNEKKNSHAGQIKDDDYSEYTDNDNNQFRVTKTLETDQEDEDEFYFNTESDEEFPRKTQNGSMIMAKDLFDHLKIPQNAPDYKTFLPGIDEVDIGTKWWYFNQDDYKPFLKYEVQSENEEETKDTEERKKKEEGK